MSRVVSADKAHFPTANHDRSAAAAVRRMIPAFGLWLLAPLTAEFLLGNVSITHLGMLGIFAPLYGGGALLIRECVRRRSRGWPSILALALAYGLLEEGILMQSLFNPDFLGQHLDLLDPAHVSIVGMGAWWTVFVLTLHTVWSISVPIALVEAIAPRRADAAWLGRLGLAVVGVVFTLACVSIAHFTVANDPTHFLASRSQFTATAIGIALLILLALVLPKISDRPNSRSVPAPLVLGLASFVLASVFLFVPRAWGWWAVVAYAGLVALAGSFVERWSRSTEWRAMHRLALAAGAAMAYASHAFVQTPSIGDSRTVTRIGNVIFGVLIAGVISLGARNTNQGDRPDAGKTPSR